MNSTLLICIGLALIWAAVMLSGCDSDRDRCKDPMANELQTMYCP